MENNKATALQQRQLATFGMTEQQVQDNMFLHYYWSERIYNHQISMCETPRKLKIDGKWYNYVSTTTSLTHKPIDNDDKLVAKKKGILNFFMLHDMDYWSEIGNVHCHEDTPENRNKNKYFFKKYSETFLKYFSMEFLERQM